MTIEYSVVLTSCGRFDLLGKTIESFLAFADVPPVKFVVVEDSGDESVRDVLAKFDAPFDLVINRPPLGQNRSIDVGYTRVQTPFVFHCEDDWEFISGGFIAQSATLLNAFPNVSSVMLRARDQHRVLSHAPTEEFEGVRFFRPPADVRTKWYGYHYNPGLRRLADYREIAPISNIGDERTVSHLFRRLGYTTAHLDTSVVRHLGEERHVGESIRIKDSFMQKHKKRLRLNIRILKHRLRGFDRRGVKQ